MQVKRPEANGWPASLAAPVPHTGTPLAVMPAEVTPVTFTSTPFTSTMTEPILPRHPDNLQACRDATAAQFLKTAGLAIELSGSSSSTPGPLVAAALEAVKGSDKHNQHCRAGTPVDDVVQQARRDLDGAIASLLASNQSNIPSREQLLAARQRLASLGADPNKNLPAGLRRLFYGEVSQWLAPHEVQAMATASSRPHMPPEELQRAVLASARTALPSLQLALTAAWDAHLKAPDDAALLADCDQYLKEAGGVIDLVFHDAMNAYFTAERANRAVLAGPALINWEARRECKRTLQEKKREMRKLAADLQEVSRLRLLRLEALCKSLALPDAQPGGDITEVRNQMAQVRALIASCVYVRSM